MDDYHAIGYCEMCGQYVMISVHLDPVTKKVTHVVCDPCWNSIQQAN